MEIQARHISRLQCTSSAQGETRMGKVTRRASAMIGPVSSRSLRCLLCCGEAHDVSGVAGRWLVGSGDRVVAPKFAGQPSSFATLLTSMCDNLLLPLFVPVACNHAAHY